jgi:hypothetical protein
VIGVTGHRDLAHLTEDQTNHLRALVRQVFTDLQDRYPRTPLLLLSSLAEGADRLAADEALNMPPGRSVGLVVPLPMPADLYKDDFADSVSVSDFWVLLGRARAWFELPLAPGNTAASITKPGPARDRQYALAGAFIARHSQVLIALWDGAPATGVGGTAEVVEFKLNGVPAEYDGSGDPLDPPERGPVYHIVTPSPATPSPPDALTLRPPLFPGVTPGPGAPGTIQ